MKKFKMALIVLGLALTAGLMALGCGDDEKPPITGCVPTSGDWEVAWCTDGVDNDCDGTIDVVEDSEECPEDECKLSDWADTWCADGVDNDCDELIDEDDAEECPPKECEEEINLNVPDPFYFYGAHPTGTISSALKLEDILGQHRIAYNQDTGKKVYLYIDVFSIGFALGEMARDWVVGQRCKEDLLQPALPAGCRETAITYCKIEEDFGKATLDFGSDCEFEGEMGIGGGHPRTTVPISGKLEVVGHLKRDQSGEPETVKISGKSTGFSNGPNTLNCGVIEAYVDYDPEQDSVAKMPVLITTNGVFNEVPIALAKNAPNGLAGRGQTDYYIDGEGNIYTTHALSWEWNAVLIGALDGQGEECEMVLEWDSGTSWEVTEDTCDTGLLGEFVTGPTPPS